MSDHSSAFLPHQHGGGGQPPPGPSKPTYSKRGKITIVACVPCRRRKTKCDGRRPTCSQCHTRDSPCQYDMNEDQRRLTFLRENVENLAEEKGTLETFLWHLKGSAESESLEILRRFRGGADPQSLVQQIQASRSLTQVKDQHRIAQSAQTAVYEQVIQAIAASSPSEADQIVQRLRRKEPVERIVESIDSGRFSASSMDIDPQPSDPGPLSHYHARPMAGNALAPQLAPQPSFVTSRAPDAHTPPNAEEYRWTSVTEDREFIEHLLDVYFMWQHSFFQNFPEPLFRQDYEAGQTRYCSRVLVNAICAAGCLLSDRPEARGDPNDPTTAGAGFFEEGMILLNRTDRSSIPTTAGVFLLSHVEGYRARLGAMWGLVGRSARMALDLNLHLRNDKMPFDQMSPSMQKQESGRIHALWGCFISDQVTALTLGRLPQILTNAITVELPPIDEEEDEKPWGPRSGPSYRRAGACATTFRQCASLSKVVNSTLLMFFAPSQIIKGSLLLNEYKKYLNWYEKLPSNVASTDNAPAHVLSLHMYYHAAVLLLFRPFLRARFTESPDITPSEICRQSATAISDLFAKHLSLYDTPGLYTFQIQCLLAACTIHLINLPAIAASSHLTNACDSFFYLVTRNTWAYGSIRLIRDLVRKWNIILPGDLELALFPPNEDLPPGITSRFDDPTAPRAELSHQREGSSGSIGSATKRAAFLNPGSQLMQKRQRLAPVQPGGAASSSSSAAASVSGRASGGRGGGGRAGRAAAAAAAAEGSSGAATSDSGADSGREEGSTGGAGGSRSGGGGASSGATPGGGGGGGGGGSSGGKSFLFAPFPNQPAPLLGPIHTSTTPDPELSEEDAVGRVTLDFDGLRFEGDGWFDPFMGI